MLKFILCYFGGFLAWVLLVLSVMTMVYVIRFGWDVYGKALEVEDEEVILHANTKIGNVLLNAYCVLVWPYIAIAYLPEKLIDLWYYCEKIEYKSKLKKGS